MTQLALAILLIGSSNGMEVEWSSMVINFYGPVDLAADTTYRQELNQRLDSLLVEVPLDAERSLGEVVERSRDAQDYFQTSLAYPQVISTRYSTSGEVQNEYSIGLLGPYIEEFVPSPARFPAPPMMPDTMSSQPVGVGPSSIPSTGFVIDARGIGFEPAVFPRLLDPEGNVIFTAGNVDRNILMDRGYISYAYTPRDALQSRELGLNPLRIVAERATGISRCDLVLNQNDVDRIAGSPLNQRLLSEGRVIIIIDQQ